MMKSAIITPPIAQEMLAEEIRTFNFTTVEALDLLLEVC